MSKGGIIMSSKLPNDPLKNFMNDFFHRRPVKGFLQSMDEFFQMPLSTFPVQVRETAEEHIITAELPGVKKEQIFITILDRSIEITVKNTEMVTEENEATGYYRKRHSNQLMSRNIFLGFAVEEQKVKAAYQNGLLKIKIPKPKRKAITISDEN